MDPPPLGFSLCYHVSKSFYLKQKVCDVVHKMRYTAVSAKVVLKKRKAYSTISKGSMGRSDNDFNDNNDF